MSKAKAKRKRPARSAVKAVAAAVPAAARPAIVLASHCSVKDAAELKQSLCLHLDSPDVTLDAGGVERIDTSTIQLLCAFVRDRAAQQRSVKWLGDARVLREAARLLGVEPLLSLPQAGVTP